MENKNKIQSLYEILELIENSLKSAKQLVKDLTEKDLENVLAKDTQEPLTDQAKVIEGIFDGENMMGPGGKKFPVPANYSSKSKLVPGDILKLNISSDGKFIFKQIGPIERKTLVGKLVAEENEFGIMVDSKYYCVLLAAVTFFKAKPGDQVTIIVPEKGDSKWAAIENVIK